MHDERSEHVFTVSELNRAARDALETGYGEVWLKGEISELKRAASGHMYFTLKDDAAEIPAVRFRSRNPLFPARPVTEGIEVLAFGRLTVYEPRGRYQFVARLLQPVGAGALQAATERLKAKLSAEGLFDAEHKVPIPPFPHRIGIVTSLTGAALRDLHSVLSRRWPIVEVYVFPSTVQGEAAPSDLVAAMEHAVRYSREREPLDVLIIGRGGGSTEDLAPFSEESVVRAVHDCPIPVISAVGHEIDIALTDFVADLRAPTPSAGGELVVPDRDEVLARVRILSLRAARAVRVRLEGRSQRLRYVLRESLLQLPVRRVETSSQDLDHRVDRIVRRVRETFADRQQRTERAGDVLRLSDPGRPLRRGYALAFRVGESQPLRSASDVDPGDRIETQLARGRLTARVEEVEVE